MLLGQNAFKLVGYFRNDSNVHTFEELLKQFRKQLMEV